MKTLLFTLTMALLTFGSFSTTSAFAHCGGCGEGKVCEKTLGEKKPCVKCLKSGKTCGCGDKSAKHKSHAEKPCTKCEQSEAAWNKKNKAHRPLKDHSAKGSLTFKSRGTVDTGYNE